MGSPSAENLALLLWVGMVLIKLAGLRRWWRRRAGQALSQSFSLELARRGLKPIAGAALGDGARAEP
jgi:hypothetical protein